MADKSDVAREPCDQETSFRIAKLRVKCIHDDITFLRPIKGLSWYYNAVPVLFGLFGAAGVCSMLGWRWNSYIIGALVFWFCWTLRTIRFGIAVSHTLLIHVHQQLIYLAQKHPDLSQDRLDYMEHVIEDYARHGEFANLGWRYAFADMLQTRLREEGLTAAAAGDEFHRYLSTTDPNYHYRDSKSGLAPVSAPYTDKDLGL